MPDFNIPEPVRSYFYDPGIKPAVDALVDKLDGSKMPEATWEEARNYNRALLMAAKVRADFIEMLFDLWERTFGAAGACDLGNEYFAWGIEDPKYVWYDENLKRSYYRDGSPDDEGRNDDLKLEIENKTLFLSVKRWSNDEDQLKFPKSVDIPGWEIKSDKQFNYARTPPVPMKRFIDDPQDNLAHLQKAAKGMMDYLKKS